MHPRLIKSNNKKDKKIGKNKKFIKKRFYSLW